MPRGARGNAEALGRGRKPRTLAESLARKLASLPTVQALDAQAVGDGIRIDGFANDPVGFAYKVLGVARLTRQQRRVLESFTRPDPEDGQRKTRVAVRSGNKRGKTESVAMLALWFYCSFPRARVLFTAPTDRQVNGALWRAIRWLVRNAKLPIPGADTIGQLARTGLRNESTFAEIVGFTAKDMESVAGISGARMLYIVDEASGVADPIWEAIDGNRAGGGWLMAISNPTRTEGKFFEAFTDAKRAKLFHRIHLRHDDPPEDPPIPGLATPEWIAEMIAEHGPKSPFVIVRVYGDFYYEEDGQIIDFATLMQAQEHWEETEIDPTAILYVGCDPAGPGLGGDETALAARRGNKVLAVKSARGWDEDRIVTETFAFAADFARRREPVVIVLDRTGPVGSKVLGTFRARIETAGQRFQLLPINSSDKAQRRPDLYDRMRDELLGNAGQWLRAGGALPPGDKWIKDLHAPRWHQTLQGRLKATDKREIVKVLGRSPDTGDAICLAVWNLGAFDRAREPVAEDPASVYDQEANGIDPYTSTDWTKG